MHYILLNEEKQDLFILNIYCFYGNLYIKKRFFSDFYICQTVVEAKHSGFIGKSNLAIIFRLGRGEAIHSCKQHARFNCADGVKFRPENCFQKTHFSCHPKKVSGNVINAWCLFSNKFSLNDGD